MRDGQVTGYTLAMNWLPLAYLAMGAAGASGLRERGAVLLAFILAWVYLLPPLVCRLTLTIAGLPEGRDLDQQARAYRVWWFLTQWQVLFNRLPALEELLRLVPGLYPLWLNLWGARVSPFAYWGPGARTLDRYLLRVDRGAVIGTGAILSGHLGTHDEQGRFRIDLAAVSVGAGAIVGAGAGLAAGCCVGPSELVPAGRLLQPFSTWAQGRKQKR
jgi:hypothetical protein